MEEDKKLNSITTLKRLLGILNTAESVINKGKSYITLDLLLEQVNHNAKDRYYDFKIRKKTGGFRQISSPNEYLKKILIALNFVLTENYTVHYSAFGFVIGKSISDNAIIHVTKQYVYNIDLKDFFHSFNVDRVCDGLMYSINGLGKEKKDLALFISKLLTNTVDSKGITILPQGSPASPIMTNILCYKLDVELTALASRHNAVYSRYADDITFSSNENIFTDESFLKKLRIIIEVDNGFLINPKKTRLQEKDQRQIVTGLLVNKKVNVRKTYIKELRMWLYYWETYGYSYAEQIYLKHFHNKETNKSNGKMRANFILFLKGKLNFLKMVKGSNDSTYIKLRSRYKSLI